MQLTLVLISMFILFFPPQAWRLEALHGSLERYGRRFLHFSPNSCTQPAPNCYPMCVCVCGGGQGGAEWLSVLFLSAHVIVSVWRSWPHTVHSATHTAAGRAVQGSSASSNRVQFVDWPSPAVENYYFQPWDQLKLNWALTVYIDKSQVVVFVCFFLSN